MTMEMLSEILAKLEDMSAQWPSGAAVLSHRSSTPSPVHIADTADSGRECRTSMVSNNESAMADGLLAIAHVFPTLGYMPTPQVINSAVLIASSEHAEVMHPNCLTPSLHPRRQLRRLRARGRELHHQHGHHPRRTRRRL